MGRLLPADEALEFGVEYASVVVSGRAVEVQDQEEAEHALLLIMKKYAPHLEPGTDYRPIAPDELIRTAVIRIDIDAWSGKEKREAPDFPGAYWFKDVR
jgi:nitroimidazol reductase NimA-like FMN-containing flavoprotein (pyridoxamine 5'-phosphate oxidase superfamily)